MKKLVIDLQNIYEKPEDVFEDTMHEDLVALLPVDEYDDMEVKGMEIVLEQLAEEITSELAENDKVVDVAENLGDIADALDNSGNDNITPTEAQLVATSANMAVAGTDSDAADLAPALEAFKDKTIAIEQLRQKQEIAYESIRVSLEGIGDKIAIFIKGLFSFVAQQETRIKYIQKLVDKSDSETKTIRVRKSRFLQKTDDEYVSSAEEYLEEFTKAVNFYKGFSESVVKAVINFGHFITKYFTTLPGTDGTFKEASRLYSEYMTMANTVAKLPGMQQGVPDGSTLYDDEDVDLYFINLIGGMQVVAYNTDVKTEITPENKSELKDNIVNSGILMDSGATGWTQFKNVFKKGDDRYIEFQVSKEYLNKLLDLSRESLRIYKNYLNAAYKNQMEWQKIFNNYTYKNPDGKQVLEIKFLTSFHTLILNRAFNFLNGAVLTSQMFSAELVKMPLSIIEKMANSNTAK